MCNLYDSKHWKRWMGVEHRCVVAYCLRLRLVIHLGPGVINDASRVPWVDPTFGISSVDVLILTERNPACRRREPQPGSCKERENLAGDAKGKGTSGSNRKAESTNAPERGGLLRSSDEAAVMVVERRGRVPYAKGT